MKVSNMKSGGGSVVPNQFTIVDDEGVLYFQSYRSMIARVWQGIVQLDATYWDYSKTTMRYLAQFLETDAKTVRQRVKDGVYTLVDLN